MTAGPSPRTVITIVVLATILSACAGGVGELLCELAPRPQEPRDRPYVIRTVTIAGGDSTVQLAGELTLPEGQGPFPGVVLISGSAVVDRDSKILGHRFFLVLADYLTKKGYAVFRHDDRGFGKSTGDTRSALDSDFAADAAAALKWLRMQHEIDPKRAGFIGHSQGALRGPMAAEIEIPNFMVFLAGGVEPDSTILLRQARDLGTAAGYPTDVLKKQEDDLRNILTILRASASVAAAHDEIMTLALDDGLSRRKANKVAASYATPRVLDAMQRGNGLFSELDHDLAGMIRSFDGPILALYTERDLLVSAKVNAPLTEPLLTHPDSTVLVLPGLNHFFQPATTGTIEETCEIETTFDPIALHVIGDWLDTVTRTSVE